MAPLPPQPEDSPSVRAIYDAYRAKNAAEGRRGYLGGSIIGAPCDRQLWYGFRHCGDEDFSGRLLALFDTGHRSEFQFVDELKMIGVLVHEVGPDGDQFEVKAIGGHFSGHMDGAGVGFIEAPKAWHVLEFKTHSDKSFGELERHGVEKGKPQHFAQMQVYMHLTGMRRAFYLAKNKNTDERYSERIRYSAEDAKALMERAERIIKAQSPPPKLSEDRDFYLCSWCTHRDLCHGSDTPAQSPAVPCDVSCRNCVHSTPETDAELARWSCAKHNKSISRGEQDRACDDHLFIPSIARFAEAIDAGQDDAGNDWIEYQNEDGTTWRNGRAGHTYTSRDLAMLPGPVVGRGIVDAAKEVFSDVTVEGVRVAE